MADTRKTTLIDLSIPIEHEAPGEPFPGRVKYMDHREGAEHLGGFGDVLPGEFPSGMGLAWEEVTAITHTGTHLDAPLHFGPTSEGSPSKTIDQIPLEWCYGDAVVLDLRHIPAGEFITVEHIQEALEKIGYSLKAMDIVLLHTGADKKWGAAEYLGAHPGMSREATLWLLDHGIKVIGTDGYGFDRPFMNMIQDHKQGKEGMLWPAHFTGREREYCHIEKLANLDKIPKPFNFKAAVFPINVKGGTAGWVRAVAIVEE